MAHRRVWDAGTVSIILPLRQRLEKTAVQPRWPSCRLRHYRRRRPGLGCSHGRSNYPAARTARAPRPHAFAVQCRRPTVAHRQRRPKRIPPTPAQNRFAGGRPPAASATPLRLQARACRWHGPLAANGVEQCLAHSAQQLSHYVFARAADGRSFWQRGSTMKWRQLSLPCRSWCLWDIQIYARNKGVTRCEKS